MKTITVNGGSYDIPSAEEIGIVAGFVLDAAAAKHLYQTRCENVRNNVAATVKKMTEDGKTPEEIAAFVLKYAQDYKFSMPGMGGTRITDPIEKEQYAIARSYIKEHLAEKGRKTTDVPEGMTEDEWDEKLKANIELVAEHPDTVKLAKKRVAERQKTAAAALEGISL